MPQSGFKLGTVLQQDEANRVNPLTTTMKKKKQFLLVFPFVWVSKADHHVLHIELS